jgi:hypothetical protein
MVCEPVPVSDGDAMDHLGRSVIRTCVREPLRSPARAASAGSTATAQGDARRQPTGLRLIAGRRHRQPHGARDGRIGECPYRARRQDCLHRRDRGGEQALVPHQTAG